MEAVLDLKSFAVMNIRFCCTTMSRMILVGRLVFLGTEDPETNRYDRKDVCLFFKGRNDEVNFCPYCGEKVSISQGAKSG